ncbi:MAG: hypothetical protein M3441_05840 [Chloroflexota bacterium]|nr:hypothetical protein [Chloroflexota bacterium]
MSMTDKVTNADLALWAKTAAITFAAALGVSGGTNVAMLLVDHPLIKEHRPTLTFRSAIWGDGVILPVVNCLMINAFRQWRPRLTGRTAVPSIIGGSLISLAFHIGQGRNGMVNWTMTRPWRWNALGYYHFIYMATQFTYMSLYVLQLSGRWRNGQVTSSQKRDLGIIAGMMVAFAVLLATDYQE